MFITELGERERERETFITELGEGREGQGKEMGFFYFFYCRCFFIARMQPFFTNCQWAFYMGVL